MATSLSVMTSHRSSNYTQTLVTSLTSLPGLTNHCLIVASFVPSPKSPSLTGITLLKYTAGFYACPRNYEE